MDPAAGINVASALPATGLAATTPLGGGVTGPRRSDGGVSLGLFSKIAAARKEKLAPVKDDSHGSMRGLLGSTDVSEGGNSPALEKWSASPLGLAAPLGVLPVATGASAVPAISHFPEIHDPGRTTSVSRAPSNPRKVTSRNFAQNLRWTKHGFADDTKSSRSAATAAAARGYYTGTARRSSPSISPVVRNVQPDRLQPPPSQQQQRRSVFELVGLVYKARVALLLWLRD